MTASKPPSCETCSQPAYNVDKHGEHTGKHRNIEECLRELVRRVRILEDQAQAMLDVLPDEPLWPDSPRCNEAQDECGRRLS